MFIAFTAAVGLTTAGAYAIGILARTAVVHAQVERLAQTAADGFSERALQAAAADPAALTLARSHDPYLPAGAAEADREDRLAAFAENLQVRRHAPTPDPALKQLASAAAPSRPAPLAARPFRLRGQLQESRDLECLTQAVYYEARGEGADGQAAVAQVVLNRTRHPAFPKTVCGVVYQGASDGGCQFSFACDGSVHHRHVESGAWRRAEKVAVRALHGFVMAEVGNATHFHVAHLSTSWGPRLMRVAQVGAHVFYRFGGHRGAPSAFAADAEPSEPLPAAPAARPVYASFAPLANSVASTVANSVAGAAAAGAELVKAAAAPRAGPAAPTAPAAEPPAKTVAALGSTTSAPPPAAPPAGNAKPAADEPTKVASAS